MATASSTPAPTRFIPRARTIRRSIPIKASPSSFSRRHREASPTAIAASSASSAQPQPAPAVRAKIGTASGREGVGQYGSISVVPDHFKKKNRDYENYVTMEHLNNNKK